MNYALFWIGSTMTDILDGTLRGMHDTPSIAGSVLADLIFDACPARESLLVVGPCDQCALDALIALARSVTVLVRSHEDAASMRKRVPSHVHVVAGALASFASGETTGYDTVVALDGLDRTGVLDDARAAAGVEFATSMGVAADTTPTWADSLNLLCGLLRPGGTLVVGAHNPARLDELLTAPGPRDPADPVDRELHIAAAEPTRPGSVHELQTALNSQGFPITSVHCGFGDPRRISTLVSIGALATAAPGTVISMLVEHALQEGRTEQKGVLGASELVRRLSLAQSLPAAAAAWVAVCGGRGRSVYVQDRDGDSLWLDSAERGFVTGGTTRRVMPATVPQSPNVEHELMRHLSLAQMQEFRLLAAKLGSWVRESVASFDGLPVNFDGVHPVSDSFTPGLTLSGGDGVTAEHDSSDSSAVLLDRAWRRFAHRMARSGHPSPWPAALSTDQLVTLWLEMSGVHDAPIHDPHPAPIPAPLSDQRSILQQAGRDHEEVAVLQAQVTALTRLLAHRDKALQLREARIRDMRRTVLIENEKREAAVAAIATLKAGRTYRLARRAAQAAALRDPRRLARGAVKKADGGIRAYRRMR